MEEKVKKVIFIAAALVLMGAVFLAGCSKNQAAETVKIAVAFPLTGDNAEYGQSFLTAAQIMTERYNAAGGVLGKPVELVVFDDRNSPDEAASIALRIVSDPGIVGVLGHFSSGVSMTAAPTYQEHKVVQISPTASHPGFSGIGDFIFRNNTVINAEIELILDVAAASNLDRIGVVAIMTDWGHTAGNIAADLVRSHPRLTLVAHEEVLETSDDHRPAIANLASSNADAIIAVGMYSLYGPLARQYREVNPNVQLFGMSNAYTRQIIELGGAAVEGLIAPVSFFSESEDPEVRAFVEEFTKRFGNAPSALAAQAFDSMGIFLEGIKAAGSMDRLAIRNAIQNITYPGVTGLTRFDANGDADKVFQTIAVQNGRFVSF